MIGLLNLSDSMGYDERLRSSPSQVSERLCSVSPFSQRSWKSSSLYVEMVSLILLLKFDMPSGISASLVVFFHLLNVKQVPIDAPGFGRDDTTLFSPLKAPSKESLWVQGVPWQSHVMSNANSLYHFHQYFKPNPNSPMVPMSLALTRG